MYEVKKTLIKGIKVCVYAAVPAVLSALISMPELIVYAPIIAGLLTAFENYIKHRGD